MLPLEDLSPAVEKLTNCLFKSGSENAAIA